MSEWLPLFLPALSALLIIALTGLPIVAGLRVRGFMSIVMTVPAAFASIAIASIIAPIIGLQWSVFVPVVLSVFIGAILWIFTRKTTHARLRVSSMQIWGWPLIAVLFTAVVTAHTLTNGINSADSISQTYDAVFHLNATKLILDTGVASPFAMDLSSPGNPSFYPTLWHATTALIAQLSGASIAVATNAMTFVTASTVWGIGAVALGRSVAGSGRVATLVSGIVASVFPALPLGLASFGVLYPNFLAMTLLPYALVGIAHLWNISIARASDPITPTSRVLLTIGALGASTLAHPNALHAVFLLTVGFSIIAFIPKTSDRVGSSSNRDVPQVSYTHLRRRRW